MPRAIISASSASRIRLSTRLWKRTGATRRCAYEAKARLLEALPSLVRQPFHFVWCARPAASEAPPAPPPAQVHVHACATRSCAS